MTTLTLAERTSGRAEPVSFAALQAARVAHNGSAQTRNDAAAEAVAFSRPAKAPKSDAYGASLYAFAQSELPVEAAWPEPQYRAARKHCSGEAMQDTNVRQTCDSLAELFTFEGDDDA